jgi:hypothetical protein
VREVVNQFDLSGLRDWSKGARIGGFTVHRFHATTELASDSSCLYFERYEQPRSVGYLLSPIGVGCSSRPDPIDDVGAAAMLERIVVQKSTSGPTTKTARIQPPPSSPHASCLSRLSASAPAVSRIG